jgi:hypothetical protein
MINSQSLKQSAFTMLSTVMETINRETGSVFRVNPMASDLGNSECRLLEIKSEIEPHGVTFRFSEDLVFQIVDLMAGGSSCHFTKVVEKPFTAFELSVIKHIFRQCFDVNHHLSDLGNPADSAKYLSFKNVFGLNIVGPKCECGAHVIANVVPDLSSKSEPCFNSVRLTISDLDGLPLGLLAETLRNELPQTCALALQMMSRGSAATVLKMLPWELQQDVGVRFLTMGKVNEVAKDLLVEVCRG